MKKKLSVLLAMSVICVAVLAGCGKDQRRSMTQRRKRRRAPESLPKSRR